jgi:predicted O-linked N-acetylglucosamine transferase (SPINDLY family)
MNSISDTPRPDTSQTQCIETALAAGDWPHALERLGALAKSQVKLRANKAGFFLDEIDPLCTRMAHEIAGDFPVSSNPVGFDRPANIYLVTEIYHSGGHRKLIEQIIAARPDERHIVLFTGAMEDSRSFGMKAIVEAGGFPIYPDPALDHFDRLLWLREKLASFAAQRLFVFHHPEDVLAAIALTEFSGDYGPRAYVVHHADTVASVGVDLPLATHLAIRTEQQQQIKALRPQYRVHLLPLVYAPENLKPSIKPEIKRIIASGTRTFMGTGSLNTATCGGMHKFHGEDTLSLPNVLASILMTTRGQHYHIGAVSAGMQGKIEDALSQAGQSLDRLTLIGEVHSVAETLVANDVDLFVTSFPSGGGLTVVEAAYAGLPIAVYGGAGDEVGRYIAGLTHAPDEVLVWETVEGLEDALRGFWKKGGVARLEEMSAASQKWFEQGHSWARFHRRLHALIKVSETQRSRSLDLDRRRVAQALLDIEYYETKNPDVVEAGLNPLDHFVSHGEGKSRPCNVLFDSSFYLSQLNDTELKIAQKKPLTHYVMRGEACGYKPHPLFDPVYCRAALKAANLWAAPTGDPLTDCVLLQYLKAPGRVATHTFFDPIHYARQAGLIPEDETVLGHFITTGADDMLSPHPLVDPALLATSVKGFAKTFVTYLTKGSPSFNEPNGAALFEPKTLATKKMDHYAKAAPNVLWAHLIEGNLRGRDPHTLVSVAHIEKTRPGTLVSSRVALQDLTINRLGVDTHPLVSGNHILKQAPYAETLKISLTQYFIENSMAHNIDPHPLFSTQFYLYNNPDLSNLSISPLQHFLQHGQVEGRLPHPSFDGNAYYRRFLKPEGGGSPILDYVARGMRLFLPALALDDAQGHMSGKMAQGLFEVGSDVAAADMLIGAIHPDVGAKHPTLTAQTRQLCIDDSEAEQVTEIHATERVLVNRPSVVAQTHIAPPIGDYMAPAATAALYREATLMPGNDGFIAQSGVWVDHGLDGFDPDIMQVKGHGAVVAVTKDKVLLRSYASDAGLPTGILASGTYSNNYFHFLLEVLPRILLAVDIAPEGTPILADDGMPEQHYQALRLYLPKHPIVRLARHTSVKVGRLYVGSMPNVIQDAFGSDMPPVNAARFHPAIIARLARLGGDGTQTTPGGRLLLERNGLMRNMLNATELTAALKERDFDVARCEELTFSEQVGLFSTSGGGIVAQSGAHLANILFAPKGTRVFALFSNAPGTNFYLWSALGALLGHDIINVAGWRIIGTAPGRAPEAHEAFTVPVSLVTPFFPPQASDVIADSPLDEARAHLDALYGACTEADTLTSAWSLHSSPTPKGFDAAMTVARRKLHGLLETLPQADISKLLKHAFFQDFSRNTRSGFVTLRNYNAEELATIAQINARFEALSVVGEGAVGDRKIEQALALAILYIPAWKLPLVGHLDLFETDVQQLYLKWLATPPYLYAAGDDVGYVAYTERLLSWLSRHLAPEVEEDIRSRVMEAAEQIDMGQLLLVDAPLRPTLEARNTLLEHVAQRNGPTPRAKPRAQDLSQGRIRIGLLCRTFAKGPDSEAVVAFFRAFDPARFEIFTYSMAFRDRVVSDDAEFDKIFDEVIEHRRTITGGPHDIRETILADDLDVFLYANATTFGVRDLERALYHRVAPIQMSLNSHLPISPGFPSFDYFVTGRSDDPTAEVQDVHHPETVLKVEGPVINFLNSLKPKKLPGFNRATLGLSEDDVVMMNGGSSQKLRSEGLRTILRALHAVPNGKLLLAPYNPGWAARSQAFAFNRQLADAAEAVGVSMDRIIVLGELSVPEAEAAIALSDIYLSSFPHGGATMTHLALIYGTPPVVLRREFTRSIDQFLVSTLGFNQMLANTPDDYVALVADLARDTARRKQLSEEIKEAAKNPPFVASMAFSESMQAVVNEALQKQYANNDGDD